jgi:hypothetical protein
VISGIRPKTLTATDAARLALLEVSIRPRAQTPADLRFLMQHGRNALDAGDHELAIDVSLTVAENLDAGGFGAASELAELIAERLDRDDPRRLAGARGP